MRKRPHQPPSHLISLGYHFSWSGTTPGAAFAGMDQLCEGNISNRKRSNSPFSLCPCIRNLLQTTHLLRKTKVQSRLPVSVELPHFPLCASSSIPSLCRMEVGDFPSSPCSSHFRCCSSSPEHLGVTFLTMTSPPCKQSCLGIQPRPLWNSPVPLFGSSDSSIPLAGVFLLPVPPGSTGVVPLPKLDAAPTAPQELPALVMLH